MIADHLRRAFRDAEISDVGRQSHTCDVKFTRNSTVVLFESKYKQVIQSDDVSKFLNDVQAQQFGIKGAVFVSIISDAIPRKGSVHFEVDSASGRLLLFLGFASAQEFDILFPKFATMFIALCEGYDVE